MAYCIYCDEGEDGDHRACEERWEAVQSSPISTNFPIPSGATVGSINGPLPADCTREEGK